MTRIGIIGAGSWGVALAQLYASDGRKVALWARRAKAADEIVTAGRSAYLPGIDLDAGIVASSNPKILAGAELLLCVVPVQGMRGALSDLKPDLPACPMVLCSKGVERGTLALPSDVANEVLPGARLSVLSGPSFAGDVVRGLPTAVTIAAASLDEAARLQGQLQTAALRPYASDDRIGAQIGGAVKNVLAIACGIVTAQGLGESARAALVARGFAEMTRLGVAMGARAETLGGLSGLGDLVLTCGSDRSRNFAAGLRLGDPDAETATLGVSEGTHTASGAVALARKHELAMPICEAVASVLDGEMSVKDGIGALLSRPLGAEA